MRKYKVVIDVHFVQRQTYTVEAENAEEARLMAPDLDPGDDECEAGHLNYTGEEIVSVEEVNE
jgi:hypothetical protein